MASTHMGWSIIRLIVITFKKATKRLGKRVRQIRESRQLSQEGLALEAGLGRSYYWRLEAGQINPTLDTLVKIANCLKVELRDLFD